MASKMVVNTQNLRSRATEMENFNTRFHQEVMRLREDETLLCSSYEGDAQRKFHEQFTLDMEKFDRFYSVIQQYIAQLRQDADNYDRTEAANLEIATRRR